MNAVELKGLCKKYKAKRGETRTFELKDVSLTLPYGCIMGLIGENGAGKSTTIRLMLDILEKDEGEISLLGCKTAEERVKAKDEIGVVLDDPCFPDIFTSVQINKMMKSTYSKWNEEQFFAYLERFEIDKKKAVRKLSKGMKMKLSIAVALSHSAKLLIMDEPTSGLDPVVRNEIVEILHEFTRVPTNSVLISSHIVSDLEKLCDYVAFIHKGRVVLCDEKDRLLDRYATVHCSAEEFDKLDPSAVKGSVDTRYGVDAVIERIAIPDDMDFEPVNMEELFVLFVKNQHL